MEQPHPNLSVLYLLRTLLIKKETVTKVITVNTNKNNQTENKQTGGSQNGNGSSSGNTSKIPPVQYPSTPPVSDEYPSYV